MTHATGFAFTLTPKPPFRLDLTVWALRRRAINQADRWDGSSYRRVFHIAECPTEICITQSGPPDTPSLRVSVAGIRNSVAARAKLVHTLERTFSLQADLTPFYTMAAKDPRLGELAARFRGMKPPRFPSMFEALINAISCQQVSLQAGLSFINRLLAAYGPAADGTARAFPRPQDLAGAEITSLRTLGYSTQKSLSILRLADAITAKRLDLEGLAALDDTDACRELAKLRGVGRWTAEYVLLRGLGRIHVFPGDDVGGRNNLQQWLGCKSDLDYDGTRRIVSRWHPYAGLVYFHLLLRSLADAGLIRAATL